MTCAEGAVIAVLFSFFLGGLVVLIVNWLVAKYPPDSSYRDMG